MKRSTVDAKSGFLEEEMGCEGEEEQEQELSSQVGLGASGSMVSCEKKRRLSVEQVKALEKNFEVENKLEPERKVKLAMELGLQPRQVAVWFQNRRARWKTKQLERDYTSLKSNYDSLKLSYDALRSDKDALLAEIRELKLKLGMIKEEPFVVEELREENTNEVAKEGEVGEEEVVPELIYKDRSSDSSDSSAIFNDENSPNYLAISDHYRLQQVAEEVQNESFLIGLQHQYPEDKGSSKFPFFYYSRRADDDEHGLLGEEEPCSVAFFSDDSPAVPWYCSEQWS